VKREVLQSQGVTLAPEHPSFTLSYRSIVGNMMCAPPPTDGAHIAMRETPYLAAMVVRTISHSGVFPPFGKPYE